jgi:hypothetical protein
VFYKRTHLVLRIFLLKKGGSVLKTGFHMGENQGVGLTSILTHFGTHDSHNENPAENQVTLSEPPNTVMVMPFNHEHYKLWMASRNAIDLTCKKRNNIKSFWIGIV